MNVEDLMTALGAAIAADTELQTWCEAELGARLTVYVGVDESNPPDVDDYPVCGIIDLAEQRGETGQYMADIVELSVGLVSGEDPQVIGDLRTYAGVPLVVGLKNRVEGAILRSGLFREVRFTGDAGLLPMPPLFVGFTTAECRRLRTTRSALRR